MLLNRWKNFSRRLRYGKLHHSGRSSRKAARLLLLLTIALCLSLAIATTISTVAFCSTLATLATGTAIAQTDPVPLQPHTLPPTLAQWRDLKQSGDYFDQVQVVPVGYLIWTHFPITVYIQPPTDKELAVPFSAKRSQAWVTAVSQAVQSWQPYLPLQLVNQSNGADIAVWRTERSALVLAPVPPESGRPSSISSEKNRPTLQLGRARSAVTHYEIYAQPNATTAKPTLAQRFTIQLRPDQAPSYLQAAARHELGHALGIWGHSRSQTDVMYFSQVRQPPPISARDVNTLKRIYEQPTRLGWALSE